MRPIEMLDPEHESRKAKGICSTCKKDAKFFKDALSIEEFRISGMCQRCQDSVFNAAVDFNLDVDFEE